MLKEMCEVKKEKPRLFQVMFLDNDVGQEVEIQEVEEIDFLSIQEHLKRGESIFITSRNSQKLRAPKEKKARQNQSNMKTVTTFYFDHV